jgi:hypothetical protein
VLALLALAVILAVVLRLPMRREVLLLGGTPLVLLLGTAATGGFGLRYLLPAVPLLAIGGALASRDLAARLHIRLSQLQRPDSRARSSSQRGSTTS